ncbi:hypothetical protein ACROYT_G035251 [Oculina patagonica]
MDSSMRNAGESRKETCMQIRELTHPKKTVRVRCWNVRTMYSTGKTAQVCREMANYKVEILGISESRWTGSGQVRTQTGENIIFAGRNDNQHQSGVAIMMSKEASRALESWNPVRDRIITARFNSKHIKTTFFQVYAPTNYADTDEKDGFDKLLQQDVRAFRGADVGSVHNLVVGNIRFKLSGVVRKQGETTARKYGLSKLKVPEIKQRFFLELKNRFSCLAGTESDETGKDDTQNAESVEEKWSNIKKAYSETAKSVLDHRQRKSKTWISATSWSKIDERRKLKKKMGETRSERVRERRRIE